MKASQLFLTLTGASAALAPSSPENEAARPSRFTRFLRNFA